MKSDIYPKICLSLNILILILVIYLVIMVNTKKELFKNKKNKEKFMSDTCGGECETDQDCGPETPKCNENKCCPLS